MITIITVFIILAAFAILWWGVGRLTIPEPIKTVVLVILGLVVLFFIYRWVVGGMGAPSLPR